MGEKKPEAKKAPKMYLENARLNLQRSDMVEDDSRYKLEYLRDALENILEILEFERE